MWWFIAGWLLVHWRWSHLKTTPALMDVWQDPETSLSKTSLDNFQHWYLADMLASVYTYHVKVYLNVVCVENGLSHNCLRNYQIEVRMEVKSYVRNSTTTYIYVTGFGKICIVIRFWMHISRSLKSTGNSTKSWKFWDDTGMVVVQHLYVC